MVQSVSLLEMKSQTKQLRRCQHCQSVIPPTLDDDYCCHGCRSAHALIDSFELNRFYEIVQKNCETLSPAAAQRDDYGLFDAPYYQKDFVEACQDGRQTAHFYLDNLSCFACVWVCEEMVRRLDGEASLVINYSDGGASLSFDPKQLELSKFFQYFEALGFTVSPNRQFQKDKRGDMARIGVSLFCLMNIMMLAFPEYLSPSTLELQLRDLFRWISLVLAGVAIFYGAWPLLKGAWRALCHRQLHLDLPIGLALLVCYSYSVWNTLRGHAFVYFDTTSAVVALLLIGRFVQGQALERILRQQSQYLEADESFVRLQREDGSEELRLLTEIQPGQTLRLLPGELLPLAAKLLSSQAEVSYGLLKGETQRRAVTMGDRLEAGAVNGSQPILLEATEAGVESYLLRLQKSAQQLMAHKALFFGLSERMARAFVVLVLAMSGLALLIFLPSGPEVALSRFAAVLLVACPCIFGFGAPLVIGRAFHLAMQRGVLFRHQRALERLHEIDHYYFDKTGTLTADESLVTRLELQSQQLKRCGVSEEQLYVVLKSLPTVSTHHVLRALAAALPEQTTAVDAPFKAVHEFTGQGLSVIWRDQELRVGRHSFCSSVAAEDPTLLESSFVSLNGVIVLIFRLDEALRQDAESTLEVLKAAGKNIWILSGDSQQRVAALGETLGLGATDVAGALTPDQKQERIQDGSRSAMVGNGMNDSLALSRVAIGIALSGATESLKEKADIIFTHEGLQPLIAALQVADSARRALRRCFCFALLFNLAGLTLAFGGWASPVAAAVLMPISSLSIFALARSWQVNDIIS